MTPDQRQSNFPSFPSFYAGRRVTVAARSGFEMAWLCEWLLELGAVTTACGSWSEATPSFFRQLHLPDRLTTRECADEKATLSAVAESQPEIVFVLNENNQFSQPLLGQLASGDFLVIQICPDSEDAEATTVAPGRGAIRTLFPGYLIGGGDWRTDRVVPDTIRNLIASRESKHAPGRSIRSLHHVLEALGAALHLAASISGGSPLFRLDPNLPEPCRTDALAREIVLLWTGSTRMDDQGPMNGSTGPINVEALLGWSTHWSAAAAVTETVLWYRDAQQAGASELHAITLDQIRRFMRVMASSALAPHLQRSAADAASLKPAI
jgi:hypothetical protein